MGHYRQCIKCGDRFTAQRATRRFCSDQCRNQYHRAVWNDVTGGKLSLLLRQVADTLDHGQAVRSQVLRLRVLLSTYEQHLTVNDVVRRYPSSPRKPRKKAASASTNTTERSE